jgi:fermentation-respiration switch protein FrsA (DUF1100 family)
VRVESVLGEEAGCSTGAALSPFTTRSLAFLAFAAAAGCSPAAGERPAAPAPPPAAPKAPQAPPEADTLDELMLFYPSKYPEGDWQPAGLVFEDVWFRAADGTRLHAWYCPCAHPRAVLLYAHGNGGNLSYCGPLMQYLQQELRVTALVFDYRGYGRSEGAPTVEGVLRDARAARTALASRAKVAEADVVLMGRSLGGAIVARLAAEARPRGLILESTFSSLREVAAHHYPWLAWLVPPGKLNSVAALARYSGPLLQSHGDADRTIPYALGQKLFEAAKGPKWFVRIAGGQHNAPQSAEYYRQLDRFLSDLPGR